MTRFHSAGATHVGHVRGRNEDAWVCDDRLRLVAVADGMGGHPAGDVASRLAVDTLLQTLEEGDGGSEEAEEKDDVDGACERMAEAVRRAHEALLRDGETHPEHIGMGTTLTALQLLPDVHQDVNQYVIGHVGDSRGYLLRDGILEPLTRDDSPLQERVDAGVLTREEARVHPLGNVLSQALGTNGTVVPQIVSGTVRTGDLFLLCSDGLTAVLSEDEIAALVAGERGGGSARGPRRVEDLQEISDRLVSSVLSEGAPDNVTVALAGVR